MTALAASSRRDFKDHRPALVALGVAAGEVIYGRSLVVTNATGFAEAGTDAAAKLFAGVANYEFDNTAGADGDVDNVNPVRYVEVDTKGLWSFAVTGTAPVADQTALLVDDNTVSVDAQTADIAVGKFKEPNPHRSGEWYIDIEVAF